MTGRLVGPARPLLMDTSGGYRYAAPTWQDLFAWWERRAYSIDIRIRRQQ
jgi:hypothetical protein